MSTRNRYLQGDCENTNPQPTSNAQNAAAVPVQNQNGQWQFVGVINPDESSPPGPNIQQMAGQNQSGRVRQSSHSQSMGVMTQATYQVGEGWRPPRHSTPGPASVPMYTTQTQGAPIQVTPVRFRGSSHIQSFQSPASRTNGQPPSTAPRSTDISIREIIRRSRNRATSQNSTSSAVGPPTSSVSPPPSAVGPPTSSVGPPSQPVHRRSGSRVSIPHTVTSGAAAPPSSQDNSIRDGLATYQYGFTDTNGNYWEYDQQPATAQVQSMSERALNRMRVDRSFPGGISPLSAPTKPKKHKTEKVEHDVVMLAVRKGEYDAYSKNKSRIKAKYGTDLIGVQSKMTVLEAESVVRGNIGAEEKDKFFFRAKDTQDVGLFDLSLQKQRMSQSVTYTPPPDPDHVPEMWEIESSLSFQTVVIKGVKGMSGQRAIIVHRVENLSDEEEEEEYEGDSESNEETVSFGIKSDPMQASQVPASQVPTSQVPASQIPASQIPAAQIPAAQIPAAQIPAAQIPATQIPATQIPASQIPASQVRRSNNFTNIGLFDTESPPRSPFRFSRDITGAVVDSHANGESNNPLNPPLQFIDETQIEQNPQPTGVSDLFNSTDSFEADSPQHSPGHNAGYAFEAGMMILGQDDTEGEISFNSKIASDGHQCTSDHLIQIIKQKNQSAGRGEITITVERQNFWKSLERSYDRIKSDGNLSKTLNIEFEGERGMDLGGLKREFVYQLVKEARKAEVLGKVSDKGSALLPKPENRKKIEIFLFFILKENLVCSVVPIFPNIILSQIFEVDIPKTTDQWYRAFKKYPNDNRSPVIQDLLFLESEGITGIDAATRATIKENYEIATGFENFDSTPANMIIGHIFEFEIEMKMCWLWRIAVRSLSNAGLKSLLTKHPSVPSLFSVDLVQFAIPTAEEYVEKLDFKANADFTNEEMEISNGLFKDAVKLLEDGIDFTSEDAGCEKRINLEDLCVFANGAPNLLCIESMDIGYTNDYRQYFAVATCSKKMLLPIGIPKEEFQKELFSKLVFDEDGFTSA